MTVFSRTDTSLLATWWWTVDRKLLVALGVLAMIGVVFVFTASPPVAELKGLPSWHFALRQVVFMSLGAVLLLAASMLAPRGVIRLGLAFFALGLVLLLLVPVIGIEINGAQRWLVLGGINVQPAEFVKPGLVICLAHLLASKDGLKAAPEALAVLGLVLVLLLMQPDVGTAILVCGMFAAMLFVAGLPWLWLTVLGSGAAGVAAFAYASFGHVRSRVDAFLADETGFQVGRSLAAIEQGGFFGRGPGEGVVKQRLPDSHADFIFAAATEEFGALVALAVVLIFLWVIVRSLALADRRMDRFSRIAAVGLIAQFGFQAAINLAVNVALIPPKGMTLPFISYGGSSTLALALGMGFLLALLRRRPEDGAAARGWATATAAAR